jgi:hypothetical protein
MRHRLVVVAVAVLAGGPARADVGNPQVRTDHPWYPGELSCSNFDRLFATQAANYRRVVGVEPTTDEHKALASWFWRNANYYHGLDARQDLWGKGFAHEDNWTREYWTGLFAFGFGLCGTTHAQWSAEMDRLLGHGRGRIVGVPGHSSFEVFLTGGRYGAGRWVLLDHDISTVIYDAKGERLLSIAEIKADLRLTDRRFRPERQHGWLVSGLHSSDAPGVYTDVHNVAYLPGYAGPPPTVHLRRGETLRRYLQPGLDDGRTFVFWGYNYNRGGVPGPERDLTWVNQPEKMYGSQTGTPPTVGRARFGNAVYTYRPDFTTGDYREGVTDEDDTHVTFAFATPYIIAATPPDDRHWGAYEPGGRNGLVLRGRASCPVAVSVDRGRTWQDCGPFRDGLDLTDRVKGQRQYLIRFGAAARELAGTGLTTTTVCQANPTVMPHLKAGGSAVHFESSGRGVVSAGPTVEQARTHVVAGGFGTPEVTLELATPHGESVAEVHAAAQMASGNPPRPDVRYHIDFSTDGGRTWRPVVKDGTVPRRGEEPAEFWSNNFCYGSAEVDAKDVSSVRVRFRNSGGKPCRRAEVHLVYRAKGDDATKVTFDWTDAAGPHRASHVFGAGRSGDWAVSTGLDVQTRWVEFESVAGGRSK